MLYGLQEFIHRWLVTWALFSYLIRHLIYKISWSLVAARFVVRIVQSHWNLTSTSAVLLSMYLYRYMYLWLVFVSPQCCRCPRVQTFWLLPHSLRPAVFIWWQFCILSINPCSLSFCKRIYCLSWRHLERKSQKWTYVYNQWKHSIVHFEIGGLPMCVLSYIFAWHRGSSGQRPWF